MQEINTEISEEEENKKREYGKNRYHNMSKERLKKLKESLNLIKKCMPISITNFSFC